MITHVSQKIRAMKTAAGLMEVSKYNNTLPVFAEMVAAFYTGLNAQYRNGWSAKTPKNNFYSGPNQPDQLQIFGPNRTRPSIDPK